jgi:hypothetical protein
VRRRGERGLDVTGLLVVDGGDVVRDVGVHGHRRFAGGVDADDDGEFLVADDDPLGGVLGDVPVGRHHHDDRLADVVHLAVGQRVAGARRGQLRVRDEHRERLGHRAVQILVDVDRDQALDVQRRLDVDVEDAGVRVRATHEGGGQSRRADVVEVAALADDQPGVLAPADRLPEELRGHAPPLTAEVATSAVIGRRPASPLRRGGRPS